MAKCYRRIPENYLNTSPHKIFDKLQPGPRQHFFKNIVSALCRLTLFHYALFDFTIPFPSQDETLLMWTTQSKLYTPPSQV